jgi:hypothetical protein
MSAKEIRKVNITYKMIRGENDNEVAETCVELPISKERYDQLLLEVTESNSAWREVREALIALTQLQGYKKLGAWNIELEIETK